MNSRLNKVLGTCIIAGTLLFPALSTSATSTSLQNSPERKIVVINKTSYAMGSVYVVNARTLSTQWGDNILSIKGHLIDPGGQITVDINDSTGLCKFNLKVGFIKNGSVQEVTNNNFDVCTEKSWTITD